MDVLENGPSRPPLGTRTKALIGVLAAVALALVVVVRTRPHDAPASAPAPAGSTPTVLPAPGAPAEPVQVGAHVRIDAAYSISSDGRDFVLTYDLADRDGTQPRVTAGRPASHPGFERLAVAVLPGGARPGDPTFAEVSAAAGRPVELGGPSPARLSIAGEATCPATGTHGGDIVLSINGEDASTRLPTIDGTDWDAAVIRSVCPGS